MSTHACPLCASESPSVARQRLLDRHDVGYFRCPACDLLFTETPHWLGEAYTEAISRLDTGAVQRNEFSAQLTQLVWMLAGLPRDGRALDFGGGHGVFVRMMRDLGFDFHWYDKHAANLYAAGFESTARDAHTLVTAFELVEHLAGVSAELDLMFSSRPSLVLLGTVLHDGHQPGWWYYLLESGQHIVFYSRRTMAFIADRYGYEVLPGADHTLFVRRDLQLGAGRLALLRRVIANATVSVLASSLVPRGLIARLAGYRSRVMTDHESLKARS